MDYNALNIYTDGSSFSSPRKGGIGIRVIFPEDLKKEGEIIDLNLPGYKGATNNQMELKACIVALQEVFGIIDKHQIKRVVLYTDSSYVVDNYKKAIFKWSKNKWCKNSGEPVLNSGLWKNLLKAIQRLPAITDIMWVKGHSKNEHNKAVDKLAKKSAKKLLNPALNNIQLRKKITNKVVERGCVKMRGQKIVIRIISGEYLKEQKICKYKYEVMSKNSSFYGLVDIIFSKKSLRAAHIFIVSFNKDDKFPQISKVYEDITKKKAGR